MRTSLLIPALGLAVALGLPAAPCVPCHAQIADGRLLERNLQISPAGQAPLRSFSRPSGLRFQTAIATGNASNAASLRADVGYRAAGEFSAPLGSDDLFAFRRDSSPPAQIIPRGAEGAIASLLSGRGDLSRALASLPRDRAPAGTERLAALARRRLATAAPAPDRPEALDLFAGDAGPFGGPPRTLRDALLLRLRLAMIASASVLKENPTSAKDLQAELARLRRAVLDNQETPFLMTKVLAHLAESGSSLPLATPGGGEGADAYFAHLRLGEQRLAENRAPEAAEQFRLALGLRSGDATAGLALGHALLAAGELEPGARQLEQTLRAAPYIAAAQIGVGAPALPDEPALASLSPARAGLVLAYAGRSAGDQAAVARGLAMLEQSPASAGLARYLRAIWTP